MAGRYRSSVPCRPCPLFPEASSSPAKNLRQSCGCSSLPYACKTRSPPEAAFSLFQKVTSALGLSLLFVPCQVKIKGKVAQFSRPKMAQFSRPLTRVKRRLPSPCLDPPAFTHILIFETRVF